MFLQSLFDLRCWTKNRLTHTISIPWAVSHAFLFGREIARDSRCHCQRRSHIWQSSTVWWATYICIFYPSVYTFFVGAKMHCISHPQSENNTMKNWAGSVGVCVSAALDLGDSLFASGMRGEAHTEPESVAPSNLGSYRLRALAQPDSEWTIECAPSAASATGI